MDQGPSTQEPAGGPLCIMMTLVQFIDVPSNALLSDCILAISIARLAQHVPVHHTAAEAQAYYAHIVAEHFLHSMVARAHSA